MGDSLPVWKKGQGSEVLEKDMLQCQGAGSRHTLVQIFNSATAISARCLSFLFYNLAADLHLLLRS